MTEGDRAASRPLCQSPVNVIAIPLINMLKLSIIVAPPAGEKPFNTLIDFLSSGWTRKNSSATEQGNGKRGSNVMNTSQFRTLEIRKQKCNL